ncbi:NAD/NADP-dependent octopine/nopaline dehydrogenase family protein [Clostridium magnum]|uniref:Opine dehydrogenase n=1 Tax=Clostridium magnum DSM 2767 TaxID=1121326 RepID=A0A162RFM1_9CLOT|nr:NAD/NADP-dependent octopine/nopaline dehydrogenase family protein [Clostridium magnum]KZL89830.1 opine dehydrogenase [Clostridium magnum DSM 2767]SHI69840.1 opine dehydrogenase [Clostridium magnum DSM 2767]
MQNIKYAVIGAGNGGQSMAAHLALKGYRVRLYDIDKQKINNLKELGSIKITGVVEGEGKPELITDNIGEAVDGCDVIMVVVTTNNHTDVATALTPYLKSNQIIVLNPGQTGGALEFYNIIKKSGLTPPVIAETQDLIYSSRSSKVGEVKITGIKKSMAIAALPSKYIDKVITVLNPAYPQFKPAPNVLYTSLGNIGSIIHPIPTLLNAARIEQEIVFDYYIEGITPALAAVIEKADAERLAIGNALGIKLSSIKDWLLDTYGVKEDNLYEAFKNNKAYIGIKAPNKLDHRFVFEDVACGLVPLSLLGTLLGIETPTMKAFIEISNTVLRCNYWEKGRTLEKIGLGQKGIKEILAAI